MLFKEGTPLYSYEIIRESGESVLFVNYLGASFVPSLVNSPEVMSRTIDILSRVDVSNTPMSATTLADAWSASGSSSPS